MLKNKKGFFEKLQRLVSVGGNKDLAETEAEDIIDNAMEPILEEEEGQLSIDMYQTPTEIIIKTMVAGVKPEDLDVAITRDMVTIRGRRIEMIDDGENDFFHKELYWGSFSRTIILPAEIETEEAEAIEKHGLLTLILPKIDKNKQAKLKIKSN